METPKERFLQQTKLTASHNEAVASGGFLFAIDTALAQMALSLPTPSTPEEAQANAYAIRGAVEFIRIFTTLGEKAELPAIKPISDNLRVLIKKPTPTKLS